MEAQVQPIKISRTQNNHKHQLLLVMLKLHMFIQKNGLNGAFAEKQHRMMYQ